jgi:metal transporter CNNM
MSEGGGVPVGSVLLTVGLICMSAAFSGLTLGLLSLSLESLELIISSGSPRETKYAKKIYPIRKQGNLLLCTLLLGNTLTNVLISIISASFLSAGVGAIAATLLIVIFGEIIPQALGQRHGLRVGAGSRYFVIPLMVLFLPVTYPIAKLLDWMLGSEMRTIYNKRQLDRLLDVNASGVEAGITHDDRKLLSSALAFSEKRVDSIMTQLKDVFMLSLADKLSYDTLKAVYESGYTRVPVYHIRRSTVVGLLFAKDLILVDPHDEIPVAALLALCARPQQVRASI